MKKPGKRKMTFILVPHDDEVTRSFEVSYRLLRMMGVAAFGIMVSSIGLSILTLIEIPLQRAAEAPAPTTAAIREEIEAANIALSESLAEADRLSRRLVEEAEEREQEIQELQGRYNALAALVEGQEDIAAAHRAILQDRSWTELALSYLGGILTSVIGGLLLLLPKRLRIASEADVAKQQDLDL